MAKELPSYSSKLISVRPLTDDYLEILLEIPAGFTWEAGQYMRLGLPTKEVTDQKKVRALSFASLPADGHILLGTRTRQHGEPSSFKANVQTLVPGEEIQILGPLGKFTLKDEDKPLVLFASGVGITPIRALVKELHDTKSDRPVEVVYVADGFHLYQEDFEKWAADMPNLTLTLLDHGKDAVAHLTELAEQKGNEVRYYLSGSPAIVESNHDLLVNAGVDEDLVEVDKLYGY
ncbi:MAG: FAD-dependent oxidoreductase [Limosilactobacillus fermentum]|uniref:FAD-dependent oxidoreductase n=1 Tax=Limosilactobacillus fermentum TaxID=1613 RepID=UPI002AC9CA24|nr:FAD-dependent oxidoreductase [Limosilactobacillus fermentum]